MTVDGQKSMTKRKKPLDSDLSRKTRRRRRFAAKREILSEWAEEEKVTVSKPGSH